MPVKNRWCSQKLSYTDISGRSGFGSLQPTQHRVYNSDSVRYGRILSASIPSNDPEKGSFWTHFVKKFEYIEIKGEFKELSV